MRGDSLRDLYAKALALVGLGLLACAGAIVDYWPVPGEPPRVARAPRGLPSQATIPALAKLSVPSPSAAAPAAARQPWLATARSAPSQSGEVFLSLAVASPEPLGEPIELAPPPANAVIVEDDLEARGDQTTLVAPALQREPKPAGPAPTALQLATNPPSDGFITGALKKTGESIVKTGAATGASIVDAFRGVLGAFKKVSPFSPNVGLPTER
jgi:hypothetical protein